MKFLAEIADHELLQKLVRCRNPINIAGIKTEILRRISQVTQADTDLIDQIVILEEDMNAVDSDFIEPTEKMRELGLESFAVKQQLLKRMSDTQTTMVLWNK